MKDPAMVDGETPAQVPREDQKKGRRARRTRQQRRARREHIAVLIHAYASVVYAIGVVANATAEWIQLTGTIHR